MRGQGNWAWIFGGSALLALAPSPASAGDPATAQQCNAAYEQAQVLRRDRKLRAARDELLLCSQSKCPGVITADCGPWLREVESGLPSVVIVARDPSGRDVAAVKVSVDGARLASRLDGTPLDVDPGEHTFTFEPEQGKRVEQTLLINMGEKNRLVQVTIRPDEGKPNESEGGGKGEGDAKGGSLVPALVVGGIGIASLGASVGLYFSAKSDIAALRDVCAPSCAASDVDPIRTKGIVSDVAFGVGLAGLGGAALLFLLRPSGKPAASSGAAAPTFFLAPTASGASAGLVGRF